MTKIILTTIIFLFISSQIFSQKNGDVQNTCLTVSENVGKLEAKGYTIKSIFISTNSLTELILTKSDIRSFAWLDTVFIQGISIANKKVNYNENQNLKLYQYFLNENTRQISGSKQIGSKIIRKSFETDEKYVDIWDLYFIVPKDTSNNYLVSTNYKISLDLSPIISTATIESESEKKIKKENEYVIVVYYRKRK